MMDRITNINNIVEILRNKINSGKNQIKNSTSLKSGHKNTHESVIDNDFTDLESVIINRINKLNADNESYQNKAKRIFIESVLIKEFGGQIADDQDFTDIVTDIMGQIKNNNVINEKLQKLLEQLTT